MATVDVLAIGGGGGGSNRGGSGDYRQKGEQKGNNGSNFQT